MLKNIKIFKNRKNKKVKSIDYSKIKDLPNYDDRVKALREIFYKGELK